MNCAMYFASDDITVFTDSLFTHLPALRKTFDFFRTYNLKVNIAKTKFAFEKVKVLGHLVSARGLQPDPVKLAAIQKLPSPTTVKELQSVLGLTGYYRKFIPGYATLVAPLTDLLKDGAWPKGTSAACHGLPMHNRPSTPPKQPCAAHPA